MHIFKWYQIFLFNNSNFIQHYSFICTQLNGSKYCFVIICLHSVKWFHEQKMIKYSCLTLRNLTGSTTPGQSGPRSNSNEGGLHIPQSSMTGASLSDGLVSYPGLLLGRGDVAPLQISDLHLRLSPRIFCNGYAWVSYPGLLLGRGDVAPLQISDLHLRLSSRIFCNGSAWVLICVWPSAHYKMTLCQFWLGEKMEK